RAASRAGRGSPSACASLPAPSCDCGALCRRAAARRSTLNCGLSLPARSCGACSGRVPALRTLPGAWLRASPLSRQHLLHRRDLQQFLRQQALELAVLVLQPPEPPRLAGIHPAILRLPAVEGVAGNAELAADLRRRHSRLMLPERGGDLIRRESLLLHTGISSLSYYRRFPH